CTLCMAILTLIKNAVIVDIDTSLLGEKVIRFGWAYYSFYIFYYPLFFTLGYWIFFKKYLKASDYRKKQLFCILSGMVLASIPAVITNLILPTFGNFQFNWVGQLFTLFWIIGIYIAIIKYRLLNLSPLFKIHLVTN